jgi:hypothetical protein
MYLLIDISVGMSIAIVTYVCIIHHTEYIYGYVHMLHHADLEAAI